MAAAVGVLGPLPGAHGGSDGSTGYPRYRALAEVHDKLRVLSEPIHDAVSAIERQTAMMRKHWDSKEVSATGSVGPARSSCTSSRPPRVTVQRAGSPSAEDTELQQAESEVRRDARLSLQ